jgi:hypothetical protein
MNLMITPQEVVDLAFSREELVHRDVVTLLDIAEAESRYIRPILGQELAEAIALGGYEELRKEYVLPALAAWCRYILEPLLTSRCRELHHDEASSAENEHLRGILRSLRRKASTLSRRLSDYLNTHGDDYVEYNPKTNPLNHCSIYGDIIQVY